MRQLSYPLYFVECTTDITILNGSAAYNDGRQYLDFAQITCSPGYRLNGTGNNNNVSESVQCLETGNWGIPRGCVRKGKLQNQVYKQILKVKNAFRDTYLHFMVHPTSLFICVLKNVRDHCMLKTEFHHITMGSSTLTTLN